MERLPFQIINNNHKAPPDTWQHDTLQQATSSARYRSIKGNAGSLLKIDAAHFIASQRMELPGKASMSQEMASPQSLPPTPKRRSSKLSENFNPNAFPGIPEDPAAPQGSWHTSHKTAADLSRKADFSSVKEVQQGKMSNQEVKESTESDMSSNAAFDVFSPADWKHQSLRDAGAVPAPVQGLRRGPLPPLEEEPLSEAAAPQDTSSAAQKPEKGNEQPWQDTLNQVSHQASRVQKEQQQGITVAEQPRAPKQTSISLQALARVHQPNTRGEATAADNRGGGAAASRAGASVGTEHTAKEYQRPKAQKPKPIRTGLEAPSYPCYIEILQKARLRPERPPGAPPRRRTAQPTAGGGTKTGPSGGSRIGAAADAPQPKDNLPVKKGNQVAQAAQQAKYAALAESRQALEAKRGQGRPQLRTEQRSAEKTGAMGNHRNTSVVSAAALLAEGQRRLETRDPAQLRHVGGRENDAPAASKQQDAAGYAKLQRPSAAVAARVPRPAFRPSGTNGWRLGQPTNNVGEDLGYGTAHARAMAAHGRACRESEAKVAAAKAAALQAERLREKAQRAVEEQAERASAERLRKRLLLSSDYTLQERLEWASNPDDTRSLHTKLLASSSGRCAPVSLRSSWEHPAGGASGKQGACSGVPRHLFPRDPLSGPPVDGSGAAGRKRTRAPEASPAEEQVYDMSAIRAGRLGVSLDSSSSEPRMDRDQSNDIAGTPRSHVSDTVLTGSGPLCDITASSNARNRSDQTRSELADKEQQVDSPDAVARALARAEAQSERASGLHCNPIFADALQRSQQEVQNLLDKEAVRCIFIQDNPNFDSLRSSLGLPRSQLTSASQPSDYQLAIQGNDGQAKQRPAYAMLGRMEVPGGAAGADSERRGAAADAGRSEQPSPGRGSASREVYILAAADAVEDALNSHRVMEQEKAEAEVEGARSQSVFNSSLSFLGKDYAPLENSLSAHVASPDVGPNNGGEVQSKRVEAATLSLDWRPANAPLTRVCEAGWSPAAAAFQGQTSTVGDSQAGSVETQTSVTEGTRRRVRSSKWSWLSKWACLAHAPAVHP